MKIKWTHEPPQEEGWYWTLWYSDLYIEEPSLHKLPMHIHGQKEPVMALRSNNRLWWPEKIERPTPPTAEELEEM